MRVFIDIETAPTRDPELIAEIERTITPPGNISKPETIAAWERDKRPGAIKEAIAKTALEPESGSIISIAVATDDYDPEVLVREPSDDSDADLLRAFFAHVDRLLVEATVKSPTDGSPLFTQQPWWVAHNAQFDLGWLWKRSVINGVTPSFPLPAPDELRHGKNCYDTMQGWAGYKGTISLSRLCRVLGIQDPKANEQGVSGANAWQHWERGELDAVRDYNRADVIACREVFHRIEAMQARSAA